MNIEVACLRIERLACPYARSCVVVLAKLCRGVCSLDGAHKLWANPLPLNGESVRFRKLHFNLLLTRDMQAPALRDHRRPASAGRAATQRRAELQVVAAVVLRRAMPNRCAHLTLRLGHVAASCVVTRPASRQTALWVRER